MPSSAATSNVLRATALRAQIEASLGDGFVGALTPAPRLVRETLSTGIDSLDAVLDGGVPRGAITEMVGPLCSGRTTAAVRTVASAMREGNLCAWVDASDAFDPESAAGNGVCLEQLLWVRCGVQAGATGNAEARSASREKPEEGCGRVQPYAQGRAGQHPRDEVRGLDSAVGELLRQPGGARGEQDPTAGRRDRMIGTPGAYNRPLVGPPRCCSQEPSGPGERSKASFKPVPREEQVSSDRQPRRSRSAVAGGVVSATGSLAAKTNCTQENASGRRNPAGVRAKPWARLDQALRAADLLLQGGGFGVLVLDLGSIAPADVLRIPLATWFRFRTAADQSRTVLLALTQTSCARSSAGVVVQFSGLEVIDRGGTVLDSLRYKAQPQRQRFNHVAPTIVSINQGAARRQPQATWQLSDYPAGERAGGR